MSTNKRGNSDTNFATVTFDDIKEKLVNRAKIYYPESYKDFNKTSFGSMMLDMIALVGEQLNFYTQFVANENFIETARTVQGYTSAANREGIQINNKYTSVGIVTVYFRVPANSTLTGPDINYQFTLLRGAQFSNNAGSVFTATEDIIVDLNPDKIIGTEFTGDATRNTYYIFSAEVPVVSGEQREVSADIGTYRRFLKVEIKDETVSDVLKVMDSSGNEYYQVKSLGQEVVYREVLDRKSNDPDVPAKMTPEPVPRRFEVRHEGNRTFLHFGFGSEANLKIRSVANPSDLVLQRDGKNYYSDISFDPSKLLSNNNFGVSPQNTTLTITYRSNTSENSNAAANTITNVVFSNLLFNSEEILSEEKLDFIRSSMTCTNEQSINGSLKYNSTQEISETIRSAKGAQGRAVTLQDYVSLCYTMPSRFGSVYRASAIKDMDDLKRNINLYIIAQDEDGFLSSPNLALKNNLKKWLNEGRMISDSIDIYSADILNLGIYFDAVLTNKSNKMTALSEIRQFLFSELKLSTPQIGQYFSIGEVEKILNSMNIISRVNSVKITNKEGDKYSKLRYDIPSNISHDGSLIFIPDNIIWEVKYENDVVGKIQ